MKRLIILCALLFSFVGLLAQTNPNHVWVNGYYRSDGTHVQGYYRTAPNNTNRDNFSTKGNINPYTGKSGWIEQDNNRSTQSKIYSNYSYANSYTPKYASTINELGQRVINYTNGRELFELCENCKYIKYDENLNYYWYSPEKGVNNTQGSSEGKLLQGSYMFLDENNELRVKVNFNKGLLDGDKIIWDGHGSIEEKYHYTMGVLDYAKYKDADGYTLEFIGELFEVGSQKNVISPAGILVQIETVVKPFVLKVTQNYDDGQIQASYTRGITNNLFYGDYKTYYRNENIEFHGKFNNMGYRTDVWKWYSEHGNLEYQEKYRYVEGKWSNGAIKHKGSEYYSYGEKWIKHGKWFFYKEDGDIKDIREYEYGVEKN
jgi:antitoxin component YwqK of YwqJK toxin-antitoxin module